MRSDRDKRSDTEREIDDFLSKFESPDDELSADYSSYLDEPEYETTENIFHWQSVDQDIDERVLLYLLQELDQRKQK